MLGETERRSAGCHGRPNDDPLNATVHCARLPVHNETLNSLSGGLRLLVVGRPSKCSTSGRHNDKHWSRADGSIP
ncbi:hypothetical protein PF005_g21452 [Phytophthora fragariae]|uniref:Uncharacterized protein n=1 Tax=Phytophthora fragariae TaxID=53985 RepID=A0A6A3WMY2_9STRA|nr:hypothetical protein PF006_g5401 [Phytophthora fragariae]KAE9184967.1 hypothetical protein PF005_g21452 [Phytophthora fragariae]